MFQSLRRTVSANSILKAKWASAGQRLPMSVKLNRLVAQGKFRGSLNLKKIGLNQSVYQFSTLKNMEETKVAEMPTETIYWKDDSFDQENLYLTKEEAKSRMNGLSDVAYHLIMGFGPDLTQDTYVGRLTIRFELSPTL